MRDFAPVVGRSVAVIATPEASRDLQQLCKHFRHKRPCDLRRTIGRSNFPSANDRLEADDSVLKLSLATAEAGQMAALQDVVACHLLRFASRNPPNIEWRNVELETEDVFS
jgi:uncharacterized protein